MSLITFFSMAGRPEGYKTWFAVEETIVSVNVSANRHMPWQGGRLLDGNHILVSSLCWRKKLNRGRKGVETTYGIGKRPETYLKRKKKLTAAECKSSAFGSWAESDLQEAVGNLLPRTSQGRKTPFHLILTACHPIWWLELEWQGAYRPGRLPCHREEVFVCIFGGISVWHSWRYLRILRLDWRDFGVPIVHLMQESKLKNLQQEDGCGLSFWTAKPGQGFPWSNIQLLTQLQASYPKKFVLDSGVWVGLRVVLNLWP